MFKCLFVKCCVISCRVFILIFVTLKCHFIFNNCVSKLIVFHILIVLRIRSYFILDIVFMFYMSFVFLFISY